MSIAKPLKMSEISLKPSAIVSRKEVVGGKKAVLCLCLHKITLGASAVFSSTQIGTKAKNSRFLLWICGWWQTSCTGNLNADFLMPYPCSHFYFDINFGKRLYSKKRPGSPLLFFFEYNLSQI